MSKHSGQLHFCIKCETSNCNTQNCLCATLKGYFVQSAISFRCLEVAQLLAGRRILGNLNSIGYNVLHFISRVYLSDMSNLRQTSHTFYIHQSCFEYRHNVLVVYHKDSTFHRFHSMNICSSECTPNARSHNAYLIHAYKRSLPFNNALNVTFSLLNLAFSFLIFAISSLSSFTFCTSSCI